MPFRQPFTIAALLGGAAAIKMSSLPVVPPTPDAWQAPGVVNISANARMASQSSEVRLGPPMLESEVCAMVEDAPTALQSEWRHEDPIVFPNAGIGARRRMVALGGMEYQLFLPMHWSNDTMKPYPVVVYLHGYGERKWSLMNSESLPRLLGRNQSTSFTSLGCWCTNASKLAMGMPMIFTETGDATVNTNNRNTEAYTGPMADCNFADTFDAIVIMPKAVPAEDRRESDTERLGPHYHTWDTGNNLMARDIAKFVIAKFNGDADRVVVTGTAEGASGALAMVKADPALYSALILTDPVEALDPTGIDYTPVMVTSDAEDGAAFNDALVTALKARANGVGLTRYLRFVESPKSADPLFRANKHTADMAYRNPEMWSWAFGLFSGQFYTKKDYSGILKWGWTEHGWVDMGYNPTMPPYDADSLVPGAAGADYNPTRPPMDYGYNPTRPPLARQADGADQTTSPPLSA